MSPRKSHPKGIDPAVPQKNFVKASFDNKNNSEGFHEYMYGNLVYSPGGVHDKEPRRKSSGFGHGVGQRAGKLRLSGKPNAYRIGKR